MNENNFEFLSDRQLSEMLTPFPPPDKITKRVSPWRKATRQMLIGFALMAIVPQIYLWHEIQPLVGVIAMFLGFRSLRKENGWFFFGYILSIISLCIRAIAIFTNSSIVSYVAPSSAPFLALSIASLVIIFLLAVSISAGLVTVNRKLGSNSSTFSAVALVVIMAAILLLALVNLRGIFALFLLIAYVLVFVFLIRLTKSLDDIGYCINVMGSETSDKSIAAICLGVALCISLTGYAFFSRYPMDWTPQVKTENAQIEKIKTNLLSLGFPEDVLADLKDEDILDCANASFVTVDISEEHFNKGTEVPCPYGKTDHTHTEYVNELRFTFITVLLDETTNKWKAFHHFNWTVDTWYYATEGISLHPPEDEFRVTEEPDGYVLCDIDGVTHTSPFFKSGEQSYESNFFRGQTFTEYFAEFSYPLKSERKRGYVTYTVDCSDGTYNSNSILNYAHNKSPLQVPVKTATTVLQSSRLDNRSFSIRQNATIIDTGAKLYSANQ